MQTRTTRLTLASVCLVVCAMAGPAAQGQTAEQLRQLQSLSPADRAAILEAVDSTETTSDDSLTEPVLVDPRTPADEVVSIAPGEAADTAEGSYPTLSELVPFGYDLFAGTPTTFAPATDIPVPVDYVIGPGDTVEIQLFGSQSARYSLVVGRDGVLTVPDIGPVSVSGLQFSKMVELLHQRVANQMIGVSASITMGPLRSIRVFVLGDAHRPGSYTVSALSTMTNALFVSGGISSIGSLRNVQLKRSGRVVTTLDLYDLLLRGDTSGDRRLQPGDVIFIPPVSKRVGVGGEVRRPAVYEIRGEKTVGEALKLAGGLLPTAYPEASQISRISNDRERTIVDIDLSEDAGLELRLAGDDLLTIFSVLDKREDIVLLQGHVYRPGPYQWIPELRITDLIASLGDLRPRAFADYVLIRREDPQTREISVLSANLKEALANPGSGANIRLQALDRVTVFDNENSRENYVGPVIDDLRLQARSGSPSAEVRIAGRIRAPGLYPKEAAMRVSDLVRASGYLMESAYGVEAELTRFEVGSGGERETRLVTVDLDAALSGDTTADLLLQPYDIVNIKEIPQWREAESIAIEGEVRFPGGFPIRRGERLSSVLDRAGGLTDLAFPQGAIFLREELRERERRQIAELADRLEGEIQSANVADSSAAADTDVREGILQQVRETQATGRLVIDLAAIANGNADRAADVVLRDGDRLLVPRVSQTVTIVGEVQFPTSYVHELGISRDEYIRRSGGATALADEKRAYVVRADGSVISSNTSLFFRSRDVDDIRPGDTIVVPIKPDPISTLSLWTSVTSIIYNIGVAAAAVASF